MRIFGRKERAARVTAFALAAVVLSAGSGGVAEASPEASPEAGSPSPSQGRLVVNVKVTSDGKEPWDKNDPGPRNGRVRPSDPISYEVHVQPEGGTAEDAKVTFHVSPESAAWRVSCPDDPDNPDDGLQDENTCQLGDVSEGVQIPVSVEVPTAAREGQTARLTAEATAAGQAAAATHSATTTVVARAPTETPRPSPTSPRPTSPPSQSGGSGTDRPNPGPGGEAGSRDPSGSGDSPDGEDGPGSAGPGDSSGDTSDPEGSGNGDSGSGDSASGNGASYAGSPDLQSMSENRALATPSPSSQATPTPQLPTIAPDPEATAALQRPDGTRISREDGSALPLEVLLLLAGVLSGAGLAVLALMTVRAIRSGWITRLRPAKARGSSRQGR